PRLAGSEGSAAGGLAPPDTVPPADLPAPSVISGYARFAAHLRMRHATSLHQGHNLRPQGTALRSEHILVLSHVLRAHPCSDKPEAFLAVPRAVSDVEQVARHDGHRHVGTSRVFADAQ